MRRRSPLHPLALLLHLFLLGSLSLAACASGPTEVPAGRTPTLAPPLPTSTPQPTDTATPTSSPTPFVPKATVRIASIGPLTGQFADAGKGLMRGAHLAVQQMAGPLMELGYKVELETYDDQMNSKLATAKAKEIVANSEILCGVGPYSSRIFNEVELIYHNAGLPFIGPSTTAAFVTSSGYPEVNRVVGRNDAQGAAGAQFAKDQGFDRIAVISESSPYAQFNAYHFTTEASRLGVEVIANMKTDAARNFSTLIDRVMAEDADLIYFGTFRLDQAGAFFQEARAAGFTGAFFGPDLLDNPDVLRLSGPSLLAGGGMYYTAMAAPASGYPGAADFVDSYRDLYGNPPPLYSAEAYDAAGICMAAIRQAAEAKGGELPTRTEVADTIRALQDYRGITGTYNFDRNGDPDPARYYVYQVTATSMDDWANNRLVDSYEFPPPS